MSFVVWWPFNDAIMRRISRNGFPIPLRNGIGKFLETVMKSETACSEFGENAEEVHSLLT
jgi:hypothetical protein